MSRRRKNFTIELHGKTVEQLQAAARDRDTDPDTLLTRLCNVMLTDNLIDAVLDDAQSLDGARNPIMGESNAVRGGQDRDT
jgi:hypothetical protein